MLFYMNLREEGGETDGHIPTFLDQHPPPLLWASRIRNLGKRFFEHLKTRLRT